MKFIPDLTEKQIERFEKKVSLARNGCWEWTGCKAPGGQGIVVLDGGRYIAARVACFIHLEIDPVFHRVLHKCNNSCVNPNHLELVKK